MDTLTHAALGAAAAASLAKPAAARAALGAGALAAMLPDLDVLAGSAEDSLRVLEHHRQFTHSLLFLPFGAAAGALLFRLLLAALRRPSGVPFPRLFLFAAAGYASAILLDACTSYGTELLWPFSDARVAWRLVAVVDPAFTAGVALGCAAAWRGRRVAWARAALGFAAAYLAAGALQQGRAARMQAELALSRGHEMELSLVKPTLGNLLLWRGVYRHGDLWQADAFRAGLGPGRTRTYPGESAEAVAAAGLAAEWGLPPESRLARDLERFERLSGGWLARRPGEALAVGDVRHAMLPTSAAPLWGIRGDPDSPDRGAEFQAWREADAATRREFQRMLLGR